ncbi:TRAP transporter substrate-binding protein [bacterium LRH843]|nr:TRAP transporter substrate-binding protein [bacterium LRH843]
MKKLIGMLTLIISIFIVTGCGSSTSGDPHSAGSSQSGDGNSEKFEFVYSNSQPIDHPMNLAGQWMADELEARTDGKITMKLYPDSVLGGPEELVQGLRNGDVDLAWITSAVLSQYNKTFNLFNASYLIEDKDHYVNIFFDRNSEVMKEMDQLIEEADIGSQMVGILGGGLRHAFNGARPVDKPEDLKGIKMRIQDSEVYGLVWSTLGANPVPLAWSEIFTGLQSAVVDGAESSLSAYETGGLYEVAPYLSLTGHEFNVGPMMMSNKTYEKLPEDLQEIVLEVAFEAGKKSTEFWWAEDELILDRLKDDIEVSIIDVSEFAALTRPVLEEVAVDNGAEGLYELIQAAKK